jgi:hypothetical protein
MTKESMPPRSAVFSVATSTSPILSAFCAHHPVKILCDSGAELSLIKYSVAKMLGLDIKPTSHSANQADGRTKMTVCGEVCFTLALSDILLPMEAIVMKDLGCDIIGGAPFMERNNIVLDMSRREIVIGGKLVVGYGSTSPKRPPLAVRRSTSFLLKAANKQTILPGDYIDVNKPEGLIDESVLAIEPRFDTGDSSWIQPMLSESVNGRIRIPNLPPSPVSINKHQHLAQVYYTVIPSDQVLDCEDQNTEHAVMKSLPHGRKSSLHSNAINIDPSNQLASGERQAFRHLTERFDQVFNCEIGKYNDASGSVRASINMGPVPPPPHKARLPSYSAEKMRLLQDKMDELERMGVLAKPEDVGITIEYSSPSFLVKKPDGSYRLVTAFNTIGTYARRPPSQSTSIDHVMAFLARFRYIITSDMTKQFFQLPLTTASMKYLGTLTPFKGQRVYTRAAMGMPGSTEHLDELMARVLGDLIQDGIAIKIADDLYTGGNTIEELLQNWEQILIRFETNNLRLSASKTVICPVTTTILGWIWSGGSIQVSPHKVTPLATAEPPSTVKGLRSWLGAFKHLKSCLPQCATLLTELESATAGQESSSKIQWSEGLQLAFKKAQSSLRNLKSITVPRPDDKLIITNDGAVTKGIGSVLYIRRGEHMHLGGFFSAKLKPNQRKWLPCEIEALAILSSLNHWAPYILDNKHAVQVLTDSRPCIQAYAKLCRGEFSHSARVSNFLSTLSRYHVNLQFIPGSSNLPADYQSRNPPECTEQSCQICKFVDTCSTSTVCTLSVSDILNGHSSMPYLSPVAWKVSQQDCPSLRRVYAQLSQGTRPNSKDNTIRDVKRYLRVCTIGKHGVLVVRKEMPFALSRDLIVIPTHALPGLISALHLQLHHPKIHQMVQLFHRYFYALNADTEIANVFRLCPQCAAMTHFPREMEEFSTNDSVQALGAHFACDILQRAGQRIFIIRDTFSSYTVTRLIPDEKSSTLKSTLLDTTAELKSPSGCIIRVDGASGFQALLCDKELQQNGIHLEMGRLKNRNKNAVAEKAIQELEYELKCEYPQGGRVTSAGLSLVTATLNKRVRNRGLSAKEIIFQRDNLTGEHLNFDDSLLAADQKDIRERNHGPSSKCQAKRKVPAGKCNIRVGDLIFVKSDGNKHVARDKYIVTAKEDNYLFARKLVGAQFRSKSYKLRYSEIYPVPTKIPSDLQPKQRHISDPSSESDSAIEGGSLAISQPNHDESQDSDFSAMDPVEKDNEQVNPPVDDIIGLRPPPVPPDPIRHSPQLSNPSDSDGDGESDIPSDSSGPQRNAEHNGGNNERPRRMKRRPPRFRDYVMDT